jgi:hypothetical protein
MNTNRTWGAGTILSGSARAFSDTNVSIGSSYEYQITKHATFGYTGYGYVNAASMFR